jgi:hypothetical protein
MKATTIATIAMLLLCLPDTRAETSRFAIVIGQNASDSDKVPDLRYADDDAVATHRMFTQAGIESVLLVTLDKDSRGMHPDLANATPATRENLFKAFESLTRKMNERKAGGGETEFLLVYSGHGNVEHGEGYIVLFNGGRLSRGDLYDEILAPSPADRNHVIVDACKSYYLAFEKGPGGERQPYNRHFVDHPDATGAKNTGFLLSTSSNRDSHEWERFQAGVFSHELRSALRGGADVDGNRKITYAELGAFLTTANERIKNPRFRPDFIVRPPGELSQDIIDWTANQDVLILDDTTWGHVYLENAKGDRLLDVHPAANDHFHIQLPNKRPLFVCRANGAGERVVDRTGEVRVSELNQRGQRIGRKGALHLAFEELFSEPFGKSKLEKYERTFDTTAAVVPAALDLKATSPTRYYVKQTAFWTAIGAAAIGAAANIWAYERYSSGDGASQTRRAELNQDIEALNTTAVVFYALAGAAAATWLTMVLWPDEPDRAGDVTIIPTLDPGTDGFGLTIRIGL